MKKVNDKILIGRAEWCAFPDLKVPAIKAKIDTGAKTSSIHAFDIAMLKIKGKTYVTYNIHPLQGDTRITIKCQSLVIDQRYIMSSNGHKEMRFVILTNLNMADESWPIELTLSDRDPLRFRLLLGREALNHKVIIDPSLDCNQKKIASTHLKKLYSAKN